jgi:hypothetical protein
MPQDSGKSRHCKWYPLYLDYRTNQMYTLREPGRFKKIKSDLLKDYLTLFSE